MMKKRKQLEGKEQLARETKLVNTQNKDTGQGPLIERESPASMLPYGILGLYGCIATGLYIYTMYPSIAAGDSGELIAAAHELGVAHPPGYPLFTLLLWLVINLIPVGNVAWRANLLNACLSGAASFLYAAALYRYTGHAACAVCGAVLWGFCRLTWTWSSNAEVFGLNNLFLAALIYLMIVFHESPPARKVQVATIGAFVCGLSLCNQHTLVIYVGIIALWVIYELHQQKLLSFKVLVKLGLLGLLGMSPYIYLPISAYFTHCRWTWGDQRTVEGFLTHFFRAEYGTFDLAKGGKYDAGTFMSNLGANLNHLLSEYTLLAVILCLIGTYEAVRRYKYQNDRVLLVAIVMGNFYLLFFSWRANLTLENKLFLGVVERFWMQSDCVFVLLATVGLHRCLSFLEPRWASLGISWLGIALTGLICAGQLQYNFGACNQRDNYMVHNFGLRLIHNLPPNATILTLGDLCSNVLRYFHLIENERPDINLFDQEIMTFTWSYPMLGERYPGISWPGHYLAKSTGYIDNIPVYDMKTFLDKNIDRGHVIGCIGMQGRDKSWEAGYQMFPYGPCFLFIKKGSSFDLDRMILSVRNMTKGWPYPVRGFDDTSWEKVVTQEMWNAMTVVGLSLYKQGVLMKDPEGRLGMMERAYLIYKTAMEGIPLKQMPDHWHKNYALCCREMMQLQHNYSRADLLNDTIIHFEEYVIKNPTDKENPIVLQTVEQLKTFQGKV